MSSESTLAWAKTSAESVERGLLMPHKWEEEYMENSTDARSATLRK